MDNLLCCSAMTVCPFDSSVMGFMLSTITNALTDGHAWAIRGIATGFSGKIHA